MKRLNIQALTHVALMAVVVGGVVVLTGTGREDRAHGAHETRVSLEGGLLTTNRDSLRVCVELAPGLRARRAEIASHLDASLRRIQGHQDWAKARFGSRPLAVEHGCPGAVLPARALEDKSTPVGPGLTSNPSQFRTFVYVLDDATADVVLGERNAGRAPAELMRASEHVLVEVTSAVLVRESYLSTGDFSDFWLTWGVGLQPARGLDFQSLSETAAKYPDGKAPAGVELPK